MSYMWKKPQKISDSFSDVFAKELGTCTLPGVVSLAFKPDAAPSVYETKRIAIKLKESVKTELGR